LVAGLPLLAGVSTADISSTKASSDAHFQQELGG
jgi:hypothetical protein